MEYKKLRNLAENKTSSPSLKSSEMTQNLMSADKNPFDPQCSIIWKGTNLVMAVFLLLAAYVQVNDPDPYIWIPIYLLPAVLSLCVVIKPSVSTESTIWRSTCVVHIALCLIGAMYLLSMVFDLYSKGSASFLVYEEVREFMGLVIVILWLSISRFSLFACSPKMDTKKGLAGAMLTMACIVGGFPLIFWSMCFIGPLYDRLDHCQEMQTAHHHHHL